VITHPTTNLPISSLCKAERTGCPVFSSLWSYVLVDWGLGDISYYRKEGKGGGRRTGRKLERGFGGLWNGLKDAFMLVGDIMVG
jgi:hypothetical protein